MSPKQQLEDQSDNPPESPRPNRNMRHLGSCLSLLITLTFVITTASEAEETWEAHNENVCTDMDSRYIGDYVYLVQATSILISALGFIKNKVEWIRQNYRKIVYSTFFAFTVTGLLVRYGLMTDQCMDDIEDNFESVHFFFLFSIWFPFSLLTILLVAWIYKWYLQ